MERELLARARTGDQAAFARLLEAEAQRVYPAVLAVVRCPEDAQEAISDASIRAWRQLGKLRDDDHWQAWFRRIAVRQAIDRAHWLRRRRIHEVSLEGRDEALDPTPGWATRITVMNALERLSPDERILLGLRYGSDLEVPDIAAALGIPLGTAKSRLHRALKRLAEAMGGRDVP